MAKKKSKKKVAKRAPPKKAPARKAPVKKRGMSQGLATLALILNVIFPGIGSLIGGKIKTGIFQIVLIVAVLFFFPLPIGILVWIGDVIWAIVTGVKMVQESQ